MKRAFGAIGVAVAAALLSVLAACGPEKVSFNTLEQERGTARGNATWNAQRFQATSPIYAGWDIVSRGDSTQTAECPVGDGWATVDLISPDKKLTVPTMCSTVSATVGCLVKTDFKTKSYASENDRCQTGKLPSPLPKIAG